MCAVPSGEAAHVRPAAAAAAAQPRWLGPDPCGSPLPDFGPEAGATAAPCSPRRATSASASSCRSTSSLHLTRSRSQLLLDEQPPPGAQHARGCGRTREHCFEGLMTPPPTLGRRGLPWAPHQPSAAQLERLHAASRYCRACYRSHRLRTGPHPKLACVWSRRN